MYFDGRIDSIQPAIMEISSSAEDLKMEIDSLHQALDRLGAPSYGPNGKLRLGDRLEELLSEPIWEKIK